MLQAGPGHGKTAPASKLYFPSPTTEGAAPAFAPGLLERLQTEPPSQGLRCPVGAGSTPPASGPATPVCGRTGADLAALRGGSGVRFWTAPPAPGPATPLVRQDRCHRHRDAALLRCRLEPTTLFKATAPSSGQRRAFPTAIDLGLSAGLRLLSCAQDRQPVRSLPLQ